MDVSVFGTGYVGLVQAAALADVGHRVLCVDVDAHKISQLRQGVPPIHEPGLSSMLEENIKEGRLSFSTQASDAVAHAELIFIAVGTPPDEDGSADLSHVLGVTRQIAGLMAAHRTLIIKSTVPVGTADKVAALAREELDRLGKHQLQVRVVSNPEFLKEGSALADCMRPDRIIVGTADDQAQQQLSELYAPFCRNHEKLMFMDNRSAELTKYAANAMLATRISFMNELALLAEKLGADIELVRRGIGSDLRIGYQFLYAGAGYGGSCFPKDVKALVKTGADHGIPLKVLTAVEEANERQKRVLVDKVVERFGDDLKGRRFAIWGLAFKPNTDDMREAPSLVVIAELTKRGATVAAYDPVSMREAARVLGPRDDVTLVERAEAALPGADALLIVTEWKEFRTPDFDGIKSSLKAPVVFDGRNLYDPKLMKALGIEYRGIGRGTTV